MDMMTALALTVGVLVAVFVKLASTMSMLWYVGAIGWACFIAAGGKVQGLKQASVAGLGGMFWVAIAEASSFVSGHMEMEWLLLGAAGFLIVFQARLRLFSFIPAGLCGAAVIGAGGPIGIFDAVTNLRLAIAFVLGTIIGLIAEMIAGMLAKKA